jgi:carboxyl-terminal processing protease
MAGRKRSGRSLTVAFGLAGALFAGPISASDASPEAPAPRTIPIEPKGLRSTAEAEEQAEHWEKALDAYLTLYRTVGPTAEVRDKIRLCFRQSSQLQRQRDPVFQQYVLSLPANDVLNIYAESVTKLSTLYADQKRATPAKLFQMGVEELDHALNDPIFRSRHVTQSDEAKVAGFRQALRSTWLARQPATVKDVRQASRELIAVAHDEAGIRNAAAVVLELLCGACGGLDEYTTYVTPTADHADLLSPMIAEFASYGILVRSDAGELVIDDIVPNSWAAVNTRMHKGLRIVRVNERLLLPFNPMILSEAFRSSSPFELVVETARAEEIGLFPAEGYRLPVPAPTVFGRPHELLKDGVGYVRIASFRDSTPLELAGKVHELQVRGMRALVLDVRGNPGGLFTAAVAVTQQLLPTGVVVTTQGQSPEFAGREFASASGSMAWDFPVILLMDTRTMSAAEVLAVALKDHDRATLVGLPTFGKGVIQSPVRLQNGDGIEGKGGVLILTVASVNGPRGGSLNGGVAPHVVEADPARQLEIAVQKAAELANNRVR